MEVTNEQQANYMDDPEACPVCGSYNLEAKESFFGTWDMYRAVECHDCQTTWEELFTLTGITNIEPGNVKVQEQEMGEVQVESGSNGG